MIPEMNYFDLDNFTGCVFSYDPVGSYERETYRACGSASAIIQPLLDNQLGYKNQVCAF